MSSDWPVVPVQKYLNLSALICVEKQKAPLSVSELECVTICEMNLSMGPNDFALHDTLGHLTVCTNTASWRLFKLLLSHTHSQGLTDL